MTQKTTLLESVEGSKSSLEEAAIEGLGRLVYISSRRRYVSKVEILGSGFLAVEMR